MNRRPLLLCTDLDRTLIPNGREPESPEARPWFRRLAAEPEVALWAAKEVSPLLRRAWSTIVGTEVPDAHWKLSTLPIRTGGAVSPTHLTPSMQR